MLNQNRNLALRPIFSESFLLEVESPLLSDGIFIYRITSEERTSSSPEYLISSKKKTVQVIDETETTITYLLDDDTYTLNLTSEVDVKGFLNKFDSSDLLYIDITGLLHTTWAVLVKVCYTEKVNLKVLYAEPLTYNSNPNKPNTYDLSIKLNSIKPIPGFIILGSIGTTNFSFIPLLGFEKRRFELMMTSVDPPKFSVYPIVGVPGYQINFPFETYLTNKKKLLENELYQNIRFAAANCPFRLYYSLYDLALESKSEIYKIALIGTKPHALGAVLFYLCSGFSVELLYDHPKRKEGRTSGSVKFHVYHVDLFQNFLIEE